MKLPGSVGVIFEPTIASVLSVLSKDSGSFEADRPPDQSAGLTLTHDSLLDTFNMKEGAHNEWRIKGFDFKGIFIDDIHLIHA